MIALLVRGLKISDVNKKYLYVFQIREKIDNNSGDHERTTNQNLSKCILKKKIFRWTLTSKILNQEFKTLIEIQGQALTTLFY